MQNKVFLWIALFTGFVLLIPFMSKWDWDETDYIIIGILLFGMGSLYVLIARRMPKHRLIIGVLCVLAVLLMWAELAVGIFGTPFAGN